MSDRLLNNAKRSIKPAKQPIMLKGRETNTRLDSKVKTDLSVRDKDKGKLRPVPIFEEGTYSVAGSMTSNSTYRIDPTREKITLCVAGYQLPNDWIECVAKFDSGCDDDWISEKLAYRIGLSSTEAEPVLCTTFDGSTFLSDRVTDKMTWMHDKTEKSICGSFRVSEYIPFDIVIGKRTLFREKIFSTVTKAHNAGILLTRTISKKDAELNRKEDSIQKKASDALLEKQALRQKKEEEAFMEKQALIRRGTGNDPGEGGNTRRS